MGSKKESRNGWRTKEVEKHVPLLRDTFDLNKKKPDSAFRTYTYIITNARDSRFSRSRMSQRNESLRSTVISSRRIRPNKNWVSKRESFMPAMCPSYDL